MVSVLFANEMSLTSSKFLERLKQNTLITNQIHSELLISRKMESFVLTLVFYLALSLMRCFTYFAPHTLKLEREVVLIFRLS